MRARAQCGILQSTRDNSHEIAPECSGRIITKPTHSHVKFCKDDLAQVTGVGVLEAPGAAPPEDPGPVAIDEPTPRRMVRWNRGELFHQCRARDGIVVARHAAQIPAIAQSDQVATLTSAPSTHFVFKGNDPTRTFYVAGVRFRLSGPNIQSE